jgi:branched-chain amino acid transport system substrate-binding protein
MRRLLRGVLVVGALAAVATAAVSAHPLSSSSARPLATSHASGLPNTCSKAYGKGQYVIASDLPLQGALRPLTVQIVAAIKLELKQMSFKIGSKTVQYVSCDDSTAAKGSWDPQTCTNNANSYKTVKNLLGVIGTFNSGCAEIIAPILNRAPGGGIAMVSPANTYVGLTKPTGVAGEPQKYFPTGHRNYARVAVPDNFQGAADATFLKSKGVKNVYVLNDGEAYGVGIANNFANAAKALGINVLANDKWDATQPNYQSLFQAAAAKKPDAVFLGGIVSNNGGQLIKDKVSVLGDNTKVLLLGPDGFNDSATAKDAGAAAEGMYVTIGGSDPNQLSNASGKAFVKAFKAAYHVKFLEAYTAYGAQAFLVLANAIAKSNGTRASITSHLYSQSFPNGIIGSFKIDSTGDPSLGGVTVDVIKGGAITPVVVVNPPASLAVKALG